MQYGDVVSCFIADLYRCWRLPNICVGVLVRLNSEQSDRQIVIEAVGECG
jgi:hypothetical protein